MRRRDDLDAIIAAQPLPYKNGRWKIDPRLAVSIIVWIVTIALGWGAFNARLSVVEARQQENERRLQRIEEKLDILLGRR